MVRIPPRLHCLSAVPPMVTDILSVEWKLEITSSLPFGCATDGDIKNGRLLIIATTMCLHCLSAVPPMVTLPLFRLYGA